MLSVDYRLDIGQRRHLKTWVTAAFDRFAQLQRQKLNTCEVARGV